MRTGKGGIAQSYLKRKATNICFAVPMLMRSAVVFCCDVWMDARNCQLHHHDMRVRFAGRYSRYSRSPPDSLCNTVHLLDHLFLEQLLVPCCLIKSK